MEKASVIRALSLTDSFLLSLTLHKKRAKRNACPSNAIIFNFFTDFRVDAFFRLYSDACIKVKLALRKILSGVTVGDQTNSVNANL